MKNCQNLIPCGQITITSLLMSVLKYQTGKCHNNATYYTLAFKNQFITLSEITYMCYVLAMEIVTLLRP